MYMKNLFYTLFVLAFFSSCSNSGPGKQGDKNSITHEQQTLMSQGWDFSSPEGGEMDESMGVKPVYGLQDNYFDVTVELGFSVAIKIMSIAENKCIRYVFVPEGQTVTVNEIPHGRYYLKFAYGNDWMEKKSGNKILGKFSRNAFYEKSTNIFDFGLKNSMSVVNYQLELNVVNGSAKNNFKTISINEHEFDED